MSLADYIERYLKKAMKEQGNHRLEIQRNELAEQFDCSPAQINYVLKTRFTSEKGYLIESRRGGGGYVRIIRLRFRSDEELFQQIYNEIGPMISQNEAYHYIERLENEDLVSGQTAAVMRSALNRKALNVELPLRDAIRARMFRQMILGLMREHGQSSERSSR